MSKKNLDLGKLVEKGQFVYLDPLPLLPEIEKTATLRVVYDALTPLLIPHTLLIITDLAPLEWIGVPSLALTRFVRAIRSLASQVRARVLLNRTVTADPLGRTGRNHADIPPSPSAT